MGNKTSKKKTKKQKKLKKRIKIFIRIALIIVIFLSLGYIFLASDRFKITEINVVGNSKIDEQEIIELSGIKEKDNIFLISKNKVKKNVLKNSYINNVEVNKLYPNKVEIKVTESEESYILLTTKGYAYIDYQGFILKIVDTKVNKPIIFGYETPEKDIYQGNRLCEDDLEYLNTILKMMDICRRKEIADSITYIDIVNGDFTIYLQSKNLLIHLGDCANISNRILRAQDIMEKEKGKSGQIYVNGDFSGGFQAYFREEELKNLKNLDYIKEEKQETNLNDKVEQTDSQNINSEVVENKEIEEKN